MFPMSKLGCYCILSIFLLLIFEFYTFKTEKKAKKPVTIFEKFKSQEKKNAGKIPKI